MDEAKFREICPEFASASDTLVAYWIDFAKRVVDREIWGDWYGHGVLLLAAHNIALRQRAINAAAIGGDASRPKGLQTSKSVDNVSEGYSWQGIIGNDPSIFNQTTYGQEYLYYARMVGIRLIQLI